MAVGSLRRVLSWLAIACGVALCLWSLFLFAKQARSQLDPGEVERARATAPAFWQRAAAGSGSEEPLTSP